MSLAGPAPLFECCVLILSVPCCSMWLPAFEQGWGVLFCLWIVTFHFENSQSPALFGRLGPFLLWIAGHFWPSQTDLSCYGHQLPFMGILCLSFLEQPWTAFYCIIRFLALVTCHTKLVMIMDMYFLFSSFHHSCYAPCSPLHITCYLSSCVPDGYTLLGLKAVRWHSPVIFHPTPLVMTHAVLTHVLYK